MQEKQQGRDSFHNPLEAQQTDCIPSQRSPNFQLFWLEIGIAQLLCCTLHCFSYRYRQQLTDNYSARPWSIDTLCDSTYTFVYMVCTLVFHNWVLRKLFCNLIGLHYFLQRVYTKLDIGLRPDPHACVFGCGFARLHTGILHHTTASTKVSVYRNSVRASSVTPCGNHGYHNYSHTHTDHLSHSTKCQLTQHTADTMLRGLTTCQSWARASSISCARVFLPNSLNSLSSVLQLAGCSPLPDTHLIIISW